MVLMGHRSVSRSVRRSVRSTVSHYSLSLAHFLFPPFPSPYILSCSMGGAIAVHVAAKLSIPTLVGLAVIDVVEGTVPQSLTPFIIILFSYSHTTGTAMDSLAAMHSFLTSRPSTFPSLQNAIEWR